MKTSTRTIIMMAMAGVAAPMSAAAQVDLHGAVDAAIVSDIARDRQAERDARRQPYASPGLGPIASAAAARQACADKVLAQAGTSAAIIGTPSAQTMSTGWEVEGDVRFGSGGDSTGFVCSVRNGSVSGIVLRDH